MEGIALKCLETDDNERARTIMLVRPSCESRGGSDSLSAKTLCPPTV